MAERKGITSVRFWEACYMDEKEKNMDLETKIAILEADKRVLAEENNKLKRELHNLKVTYDKLIEDNKEQATEHHAVDRLLERKIEEIANLRRTLYMAEKWTEGQKKYIRELKEQMGYTETVEICPHCMSENTYPNYNADGNNYKAICKNCGKEIMLCDECLHAADNKSQKCDWSEINGCFRQGVPDEVCEFANKQRKDEQ